MQRGSIAAHKQDASGTVRMLAAESWVELQLLAAEVRILAAHHRDLAQTMHAEGNHAAAKRLKERARQLDMELGLQLRLGPTVARLVRS